MLRVVGAATCLSLVCWAGGSSAVEYRCEGVAKGPSGSAAYLEMRLTEKGQIVQTRASWHPPVLSVKTSPTLSLLHAYDASTGTLGEVQDVEISVVTVNQKEQENGSEVRLIGEGIQTAPASWEKDAKTIDLTDSRFGIPAVTRIGKVGVNDPDLVSRVLSLPRVSTLLLAKDGAELRRAEYDLSARPQAVGLFKTAQADAAKKMKSYRRACRKAA